MRFWRSPPRQAMVSRVKGCKQPFRGAWPAGTASHQGESTAILGEDLDQLAGLPIGPTVDDESRGQQSVVAIPEAARARSSSAHRT